MKKSELRQLIREEIGKLNEVQLQYTYVDKHIHGRNATKLIRAVGEQGLDKYVKRVNNSDTELIITQPKNETDENELMDIIDNIIGIKNIKYKK